MERYIKAMDRNTFIIMSIILLLIFKLNTIQIKISKFPVSHDHLILKFTCTRIAMNF